MAVYLDQFTNARAVYVVGADGNPQTSPTSQTYQLAASVTLAGNAVTTPTAIQGGSYVWSYQFGGTSPSLVLEALGPDGVTYQTVATVTASGTQGVVMGEGSSVRLRNNSANAITTLSSRLS